MISTIIVVSALLPWMHELLKIHKTNAPLRQIVSAIGSSTYNLVFSLHVRNLDTYIKDSIQCVDKLKNIILQPTDLVVSFDVILLFSMLPVQKC